MQHFIETLTGRYINLAHVVTMRRYKDGYHCCDAQDEEIGVVSFGEAFDVSTAIVPNTLPGVALLSFYRCDTGDIEFIRHPIIAWAIVRRTADPIIADDIDEPWCIEYQNATSANYIFPWLCTCETLESALAYAADHFQNETKRQQAKAAKEAVESEA